MFCTNCEFEIKGEGRKECPICGGLLIEYFELETSSEETKGSWESGKGGETAQGSKETTFFDLESALKTDDETGEIQKLEDSSPASFALESEPDPVVEEESIGDIVASALTSMVQAQLRSRYRNARTIELKPGRSSRILPTITIIAVLAVVAAFGSIAFLKPQLKLYPVIAQLKTETEKSVVNILNIITKKDKKKVVAEKEPEPFDSVQRAQKKISEEKAAFVKEISILEKTFEKGKEEKALVKKEPEPIISSAKTAQKEVSPKKIASLREILPAPEKKVAVSESSRLKKQGFNTYMQTADFRKGQVWHRIKIGDFNTSEEAQKVRGELSQKDPALKSFIIVERAESKQTLIKGEEKSMTIKELAPDVSQPVEKEMPQEETGAGETTPSAEEAVTTDLEQPIKEMESAPDVSQPVEKEMPQEETGAIRTISSFTPEEGDQLFEINVVSENTVKEEIEVVIPSH
jgi:hypothetical protein